MKFLQKLIGVVTYSEIEYRFDELVAEFEHKRNKLRKEAFDEIEKLNPTKDGEKLQKLFIQMNRDITTSYEQETTLREFVSKLK